MQSTGMLPGSWSTPVVAGANRPATPDGGVVRPDSRNLDGVARQFEQLLVRQLLSQMRNASLGADADAQRPSAGYLQLADDHLAATVVAVGGLGLASSARRWMQGLQAYQAVVAKAPG